MSDLHQNSGNYFNFNTYQDAKQIKPETNNVPSTKVRPEYYKTVQQRNEREKYPLIFNENDVVTDKIEYLNILKSLKFKIKDKLQRSINNAHNEIIEGNEALQTLQTLNKAFQPSNQNQEIENITITNTELSIPSTNLTNKGS